jgi:hypothetical protein
MTIKKWIGFILYMGLVGLVSEIIIRKAYSPIIKGELGEGVWQWVGVFWVGFLAMMFSFFVIEGYYILVYGYISIAQIEKLEEKIRILENQAKDQKWFQTDEGKRFLKLHEKYLIRDSEGRQGWALTPEEEKEYLELSMKHLMREVKENGQK